MEHYHLENLAKCLYGAFAKEDVQISSEHEKMHCFLSHKGNTYKITKQFHYILTIMDKVKGSQVIHGLATKPPKYQICATRILKPCW